MKKTFKKIWGIVLTVMMVLSLLPLSAFAEEKLYPVVVGSVQVSEKNKNDVLGDKTVKFDPATSTLTLNNAKITALKSKNASDTFGVLGMSSINIVLKGKNTIQTVPAVEDNYVSFGILAYDLDKQESKNINISGDGTLIIKGSSVNSTRSIGISANNLMIKSGGIEIQGGSSNDKSWGIEVNGDFTMINGNVNVVAKNAPIIYGIGSTDGNIDIKGGKIYVRSDDSAEDSFAIVARKSLNISGGDVQAVSATSKALGSIALYGMEKISISGGKVVAKSGKASQESRAIYSKGDLLIRGGDIVAESIGSDNYASGIDSGKQLVISKAKVTAKIEGAATVAVALKGAEKAVVEDGEVYAEATTGQKLGFGIGSFSGYLLVGDEPAWVPGEGVDIQGGNVIVKGVPFAISSEVKIKESIKSDVKISKEVDGKNASQWDGKPEALSTANFVQIGSNSKTSTGNESSTNNTSSTESANGAIKLKIGSKEMIKNVDGADQKTMMDAAPFVNKGRTMVPLRYVAEALGLEVKMDTASRSVVLSNADKKIQIPLNSLKMMANDKEVMSDVLPIVKEGRTYLSISNIGKALGLESGKNLIWDAKTKEITVIP